MGNGARNSKKPPKSLEESEVSRRNLSEFESLSALKMYGLQKLAAFPAEMHDFPSPLSKNAEKTHGFAGIVPRKHSSENSYAKFNPFLSNSPQKPSKKPAKHKASLSENVKFLRFTLLLFLFLHKLPLNQLIFLENRRTRSSLLCISLRKRPSCRILRTICSVFCRPAPTIQ